MLTVSLWHPQGTRPGLPRPCLYGPPPHLTMYQLHLNVFSCFSNLFQKLKSIVHSISVLHFLSGNTCRKEGLASLLLHAKWCWNDKWGYNLFQSRIEAVDYQKNHHQLHYKVCCRIISQHCFVHFVRGILNIIEGSSLWSMSIIMINFMYDRLRTLHRHYSSAKEKCKRVANAHWATPTVCDTLSIGHSGGDSHDALFS